MRWIAALFIIIIAAATFASPVRFYYVGTLGSSAMQMDLQFAPRGVELEPEFGRGQVFGHFQLDDGAWHDLEGSMRGGGVTLHEHAWYDDGTKARSTFVGRLSGDRKTVSGTWVSGAKTVKIAFAVQAVAEYRAVRLPHRRLLALTGAYPVFYRRTPALRALETQCRTQILATLRRFRVKYWDAHEGGFPFDYYEDVIVNLAYYSPKLVSLRVMDNTYTGGAHGYEDTTAQNYLLAADGPVRLGLHHIFQRDSRYHEALADLLLAEMERERPESLIGRPAADDMTVYTVSKAGITFIFPPYELSCYADGTLSATVPFSALAGYLAHTDVTKLLRAGTQAAPAVSQGANPHALHIATAWQAAALPRPRRDSYLQARVILSTLAGMQDDLDAATDFSAYAERTDRHTPDVEVALAAIVQSLRTPMSDPAARARASASLAAAETRAKVLVIPPKKPEEPEQFANRAHALLHSLADLTLAAPAWPDRVAELACAYAEQALAPAKQEGTASGVPDVTSQL